MTLVEILGIAKERGASDLLIMVGDMPAIRVAGKWHRLEMPACKKDFVQKVVEELLHPDPLEALHRLREVDFSRTVQPAGRVRCNVHYQRDHLAMVLRLVWPSIPDARKLGIPEHVIRMGETHHGLILISGPTGSGKSTTLASMVQHINQTRPAHVITIEDPIEYIYSNAQSIIEQREVGSDTHSWESALRSVLRQAPDVIVLGELRDLESISIALLAAETGHLVMASVHASTATGAVSRIIDSFPAAQIAQVRLQLSQALRMVFAQRLVPGKNDAQRVLNYEILMGTPAISNMIRSNELEQIHNQMGGGREHGMLTFAQCTRDLQERGILPAEAVLSK